ncbi:MAG: CvpA family protein [Lachnospiraceae bacterium]|nr:CvpA family protein [Lachnospiraceae bacterium]MBQ8632492.1 CvpA family protein [Lachnospiraceae bacterium]
MNWLLIFALAIIGVFAFIGWRVGFVKSVFSLVSTIAVIIITILVSPIVSNMLKDSEKISGGIQSKLEQVIDLSGVADNLSAEEEKDPMAFIDGLGLPESIKDTIKDSLTETMEEKKEEAANFVGEKLDSLEKYICERLTNIILNALGFFITFIVAAVGIAVLCFVLDLLSKLPVLHQINTVAGIAMGALEGLVILWIVFIVITMLGSTGFGQACMTMISESKILSFLYDSNILSKFLLGKA